MTSMTSARIASHLLRRREFLRNMGGLGLSAAGLALLEACGSGPAAPPAAAETLETTTIQLGYGPSICLAPTAMAEDLLKGEGFTRVQYANIPSQKLAEALAAG